ATLRSLSADATIADSPSRPIPTSYGLAGASYIDARLNPLLQNNEGRVLADGATAGGEALVDFTLDTHFAGQLHPRPWTSDARGATADVDATIHDAYLRALFGNWAIDAGRNHVADGYGSTAGPVLSHNPRGLDLLRLSFDRPATLPWFFGALGPINAS